jgi:hypothetical protein
LTSLSRSRLNSLVTNTTSISRSITKSLILNIKSKLNLEESAIGKELKLGTIYLTAFRELIFNKVTFISAILANKAFSYLLILKNITKPILTTDPFIYILNISSS